MNNADRQADITNLLNVQPDTADPEAMERWAERARVELTYLVESLASIDRLTRERDEAVIDRRKEFDNHIRFMQAVALAVAPGTENEALPNEDRLVESVAAAERQVEQLSRVVEAARERHKIDPEAPALCTCSRLVARCTELAALARLQVDSEGEN
jgi:sugar phosphate isomerase/epimerase